MSSKRKSIVISPEIEGVGENICKSLDNVDRILAELIVEEASACKTLSLEIDNELALAKENIRQARNQSFNGFFEKSGFHYNKAREHARKVINLKESITNS